MRTPTNRAFAPRKSVWLYSLANTIGGFKCV